MPVFVSGVLASVFVCIGISDQIHILACVYIWGNVSPDLSVTEDGLFPPQVKTRQPCLQKCTNKFGQVPYFVRILFWV